MFLDKRFYLYFKIRIFNLSCHLSIYLVNTHFLVKGGERHGRPVRHVHEPGVRQARTQGPKRPQVTLDS